MLILHFTLDENKDPINQAYLDISTTQADSISIPSVRIWSFLRPQFGTIRLVVWQIEQRSGHISYS